MYTIGVRVRTKPVISPTIRQNGLMMRLKHLRKLVQFVAANDAIEVPASHTHTHTHTHIF